MDRPRFGRLEATRTDTRLSGCQEVQDRDMAAVVRSDLHRQMYPHLRTDLPFDLKVGPLLTEDTATGRTWTRRAVCLLLHGEEAEVGDHCIAEDYFGRTAQVGDEIHGMDGLWVLRVVDLGGPEVVRCWERVK